MSGGSYDYFYCNIAGYIEDLISHANGDPRRLAFINLMKLISSAAYNIELVDSGDMVAGDENKAIDAVFGYLSTSSYKAAAFDQIVEMMGKLKE